MNSVGPDGNQNWATCTFLAFSYRRLYLMRLTLQVHQTVWEIVNKVPRSRAQQWCDLNKWSSDYHSSSVTTKPSLIKRIVIKTGNKGTFH